MRVNNNCSFPVVRGDVMKELIKANISKLTKIEINPAENLPV